MKVSIVLLSVQCLIVTAYRVDDEEDEMVVNDQAVERLVIVTRVRISGISCLNLLISQTSLSFGMYMPTQCHNMFTVWILLTSSSCVFVCAVLGHNTYHYLKSSSWSSSLGVCLGSNFFWKEKFFSIWVEWNLFWKRSTFFLFKNNLYRCDILARWSRDTFTQTEKGAGQLFLYLEWQIENSM